MQSLAASLSKTLFFCPNGSRSRVMPSFPDSKSSHLFDNPIKARQISLIPHTIPSRGNCTGPPNSPSALDASLIATKGHSIKALSRLPGVEILSGRDRHRLTVTFCSLSSSASASTPEEAFVRKTVSSHDIVIFSKSYCPYCKRAKAVFEELKKVPYVVELDDRDDGQDIQDALSDIVGRRTVPQVFIKGKHVGGSDDTVEAYQDGTLAKLLGA